MGRAHFGGGVVFWLRFARHHGPCFVGVYELVLRGHDNAGGAREDEGLDARVLRCLDEVVRAFHVDFVEDFLLAPEPGRRGVNHDIRFHFFEHRLRPREIGDVAVVVGYCGAGMAIVCCAKVEDGDLSFWVSFDDERDDVAAEEAAAAYDEDFS